MASVDANLTALDNQNVMADQIIRVAKVHLQTISGATVLQKEIGTKTYIINRIFQSPCLFVVGYQTVVNWIDSNFDAFQCQVNIPSECTRFAYNLSRIKAGYYNAYIMALVTSLIGDPMADIPVLPIAIG